MAETITLGDRSFEIKKLPITHLLQLAAIIDEPTPEELTKLIDRGARIISVALRHIDPSMTDENIRSMGASLQDLNDAAAAIMRVAGFQRGEVPPAAAGLLPINSTISSVPSLPDADTDRPTSIN